MHNWLFKYFCDLCEIYICIEYYLSIIPVIWLNASIKPYFQFENCIKAQTLEFYVSRVSGSTANTPMEKAKSSTLSRA